MVEVELTWGRILKIWWNLLWRYLLYALIFGLVIGFFIVIVMRFARFDKATYDLMVLIMATITALIVSIWVVKNVFQKKRFGDFRIVLLTDVGDAHLVEKAETNKDFDIR